MMGSLFRASILCALLALAGMCYGADGDLLSVAAQEPDISTFNTVIGNAGLKIALSEPGPYTIFAPVDCAWAQLSCPTAEQLMTGEYKSMLASIMQYQVVCGAYTLADFKKNACCPMILQTVGGGTLTIREIGGEIYVDGARLISTGETATNGVVFKIDRVIVPPGIRIKYR